MISPDAPDSATDAPDLRATAEALQSAHSAFLAALLAVTPVNDRGTVRRLLSESWAITRHALAAAGAHPGARPMTEAARHA